MTDFLKNLYRIGKFPLFVNQQVEIDQIHPINMKQLSNHRSVSCKANINSILRIFFNKTPKNLTPAKHQVTAQGLHNPYPHFPLLKVGLMGKSPGGHH